MIVGTLFGLLLATIGVGWYGFERMRQIYEQVFHELKQDRDDARHEAKVFRRLVLPVYDKAESSLSGTAPASTPAKTPVGAPEDGGARTSGVSAAPSPFLNRRVPFRIRFKQQAAATNNKQKNTDVLATAVAAQKPTQKPENSSHV